MLREQRIRAFLYYLSVFIFLIGLPLILSFSLSYKFDRRTFKFTKTGLIVIRTQPSGARVYLDKKLLDEKTPLDLNELLPGSYHLKIELEEHYPWVAEVEVGPGKVTRLEKIILFPTRSNVRQLNKERIHTFWLDEEKGIIYYANQEDRNIYKSDLDGDNDEKIASFLEMRPAPRKFVISPDRKKVLYFNQCEIGVTYLEPYPEEALSAPNFVLDYSGSSVNNLFWHSDSYHLILISDKEIKVLEAKPQSQPLTLVDLNKKNTACFYDLHTDTLYFMDTQKAADGNFYDNLYKLELNARNFPSPQELIKVKANE